MIDGLETPEEAQEKIDALEAAYPSAPDSVEPVPATPKLKRIPVDLGEYRNVAHYYGLHATNNEQRLFFNVHKHRLTRAHREKQLKMSCQALHNAPPNRT